MKKFIYTLAAVLLAASCQKDPVHPQEELLPVTHYNIDGTWQLGPWNGESLALGTYAYITFDRSEKTFTSVSNFDSFAAVKKTGRYDLYDDDVIYGIYDFQGGNWSHRYVITELTANTMAWTAEDDPTQTRIYFRSSVPDQILADLGEPAQIPSSASVPDQILADLGEPAQIPSSASVPAPSLADLETPEN